MKNILQEGVIVPRSTCTCSKVFTPKSRSIRSRCPSCTDKAKGLKKLNSKEKRALFNAFISALDTFYERTDGRE